jgi:hypothetical protein
MADGRDRHHDGNAEADHLQANQIVAEQRNQSAGHFNRKERNRQGCHQVHHS